jgi:hypothetical protein
MDHQTAITTHAAEKYWEGGLSGEDREGFEEHFFGCAECAEEVRWEKLFQEQARAELEGSVEPERCEPQFLQIFRPGPEGFEIYREATMFALAFDVPADRRFYSYTVEIDDRWVSSLPAPPEPYTTLHLAMPARNIELGEHELVVRGARAAEIVRCHFRVA